MKRRRNNLAWPTFSLAARLNEEQREALDELEQIMDLRTDVIPKCRREINLPATA